MTSLYSIVDLPLPELREGAPRTFNMPNTAPLDLPFAPASFGTQSRSKCRRRGRRARATAEAARRGGRDTGNEAAAAAAAI